MTKFCMFILIMSTFSLVIWSTSDLHAQNSDVSYGAYGHYPVGSTRVLGMGGAFTGLADDASAVVTNPAGLSFAKQVADFTSGENRVVNREIYFGPVLSEKAGLPYTSQFRAAAIRLGPLGLGAAYSLPYSLDYTNGGSLSTHRILKIQSYDASASLSFFKMLSLGATVRQEHMAIAFQNSDETVIESKQVRTYPSFGVLLKPDKKTGIGITYTPERRYDVDETLDSRIEPTANISEWFHNVVIPGKVTLGLAFQRSDKLNCVGDIDIYQPVKNAIYVGGSASTLQDKIIEDQQVVFHGGFEYYVQKKKNLDFIWRGGGYQEPRRVEYASDRLHFTMGIEVRFYFLVLAASYDQASGFSNVAQSAGISLGEI